MVRHWGGACQIGCGPEQYSASECTPFPHEPKWSGNGDRFLFTLAVVKYLPVARKHGLVEAWDPCMTAAFKCLLGVDCTKYEAVCIEKI